MKNPLVPARAVIRRITDEMEDTRTYHLYLEKTLMSPKPGQFNMMGWPGVGEAPISFSGITGAGEFEHTVKAVGRVTRYLAKFGEGDEVFLRGPYGTGWPLDQARDNSVLIVAGGLGLAPLRPVIREILQQRELFRKAILVYGARTPEDLLYRPEFEQWKTRMDLFLTVDEVPPGVEWGHGTGLVTGLLEKSGADPKGTVAFVCGPEIMMRFVGRQLLVLGFPMSKIYVSLERRMRCGIVQCGHCQHGPWFVCKDGPVFPYASVKGLPDSFL